MTNLIDREALLATVRSIRDDIERAIAAMTEEQTAPDGAWSLKDVIAHLTSWRLTTAARLEAGLHGGEPIMPWPAPLDEERDLDEINRWFDHANRVKAPADVARESRDSFERVERALTAMPAHDLFAVGHFAWMPDHALGPAVIAGTLEHHQEHEPDIRAWLDRA
jgi:hypothetical protein